MNNPFLVFALCSRARARASLPNKPMQYSPHGWPIIPNDVIFNIILPLLPVKVLLHTASLVCKRWRKAVLTTINTLSSCSSPNDAIQLFPNLRSLSISAKMPVPICIPSTITSLNVRIARHEEESCPLSLINVFSGVSTLRVELHSPCIHLRTLLGQCKGLVSLSIANDPHYSSSSSFHSQTNWERNVSMVTRLRDLHLSNLSRLSLRGVKDGFDFQLAPFVARHASQLESFSFHEAAVVRWNTQCWLPLSNFAYPNLRHLSLGCSTDGATSVLRAAYASNRDPLSLGLSLEIPQGVVNTLPLDVLPLIKKLRLTTGGHLDSISKVLSMSPHLRSIRASKEQALSTLYFTPRLFFPYCNTAVMNLVREMHIDGALTQDLIDVLCGFSKLDTLRISALPTTIEFLPTHHLQSLSHLHITGKPFRTFLDSLRNFLRVAPHLHTIETLFVLDVLTAGQRTEFERLLKEAQQQSLQVCILHTYEDQLVAVKAITAKLTNLCVKVKVI